jgi:hypothetical protein
MLVVAMLASFYLLNQALFYNALIKRYESDQPMFVILSESEIDGFRMIITRNVSLTIVAWATPIAFLFVWRFKKVAKSVPILIMAFILMQTLFPMPAKAYSEKAPYRYYARVEVTTLEDLERFTEVWGNFAPIYDVDNSWTCHHVGVIVREPNIEWLAGGYMKERGKPAKFYIEYFCGQYVEIQSDEKVVYGKRYGIALAYRYDLHDWTIRIFDSTDDRVIMEDHAAFSPSDAVVDMLVAGSECPNDKHSMSAGFDELWYGGKCGPSQYHYSKFFNSTYVSCQKIEYFPFAVDLHKSDYCFTTHVVQRRISNLYLIRNNQVLPY